MKVQNKVIVVTGGGSGMGRELTLNLLSKNAKVIAIDINQNGLQETVSLAGANKNNLCTFVVDITSKVAVEALFEKAIIQFGFVDGIINNAGIIQPFIKVNELSYEAIERVMNVNFYGTLYMTVVFPGAVNTNITKNSGLGNTSTSTTEKQSAKILSAAKAVKIIVEGMERDQYRILVGKDAKFLDFIYRLNPKFAAKFISSKMKERLKN